MRTVTTAAFNLIGGLMLTYAVTKMLFGVDTTGVRAVGNIGGLCISVALWIAYPWRAK